MNVSLARAARRVARTAGTPAYLYDLVQLEADARAVRTAFPEPWILLYALKANGLPGLLSRLPALGFGAAAVSRGELSLAARAGFGLDVTALEGIGKTPADLRAAVRNARAGTPLRWISLESVDEAADLARAASALGGRRSGGHARPGVRLDVLIRLNPAGRPETRRGPVPGAGDTKFGVAAEEIPAVVAAGGGTGGPLCWRGLHVHVGSQLGAVDAWRSAMRVALAVMALSRSLLPDADTLDAGSGFPVGSPGDAVPALTHFAAAADEVLAELPPGSRPARLAIEPGRAVVARCGWLLARVLHVRERDERQIVVDAGMPELIRPALYGARHPIVALTSLGRPWDPEPPDVRDDGLASGAPFEMGLARIPRGEGAPDTSMPPPVAPALVDGPACESTDRVGEARLPQLRRGDIVAIGLAGAYGSAMSSRYSGRPSPPEIAWDGDRLTVMRPRGRRRTLP
jgi:diaminopimelate decarboxylase